MSTAIKIPSSLYQQARAAEVLTITWMVVEAIVAVGTGVVAMSVALTAFGFDSVIEVFSAAVVLRQLLRPRSSPSAELREGERRASWLTGIALYAVAVYIVASSAYALVFGIHPEPSTLGLALAVASAV